MNMDLSVQDEHRKKLTSLVKQKRQRQHEFMSNTLK